MRTVVSAILLLIFPLMGGAIAAGRARSDPSPAAALSRIDFDKLTTEATALLQAYIRMDTTDPPGNELAAAKMLKEKFLGDGIPATVWQPQPGRGIVAARLHGRGHHTKALVLLSHMDVGPANPRQWGVPPFSGELKNGAIWGRGALDDKGPGVVALMAMLAIKRAGILLDRDILFIATDDEELGGRNGAGWFVEHEPDVFADAGYLLDSGGGIETRPNGRQVFSVAVTEKAPLWLRLTASGRAGDAAIPPDSTAVTRLVHGLDRLAGYRGTIRIVDPVRDYFKTLAELDGGPPALLDLRKAFRDPDFAKRFLADPRQNALVRDTCTPTMLEGSSRIDLIPAGATAAIDCRLLPGEDPQRVVTGLRKAMDDESLKLSVVLNFPAVSSARKSQLMTAIDRLGVAENAKVVPTMFPGFTDSYYFRQKGLIAYGFMPIAAAPAELNGIHSVNERIAVVELQAGIRRMVMLLELMGH